MAIKWDHATNAQKIERAAKLVEVLEGLTMHEQRKHFDMGDWLYKTDCGTVGCAAGFCGLNPWFRARGFKIDLVPEVDINGNKYFNMIFGMKPDVFFGKEIQEEIFTNGTFMNDGGRKDYLLVLKAAKLYLKKITAQFAYQDLEQSLERAQFVLNASAAAFKEVVTDN